MSVQRNTRRCQQFLSAIVGIFTSLFFIDSIRAGDAEEKAQKFLADQEAEVKRWVYNPLQQPHKAYGSYKYFREGIAGSQTGAGDFVAPGLIARGIWSSFLEAQKHRDYMDNLVCLITMVFDYAAQCNKRGDSVQELQFKQQGNWLIQNRVPAIGYDKENHATALHILALWILHNNALTDDSRSILKTFGTMANRLAPGGTSNLSLIYHTRRYLWYLTGESDLTDKKGELSSKLRDQARGLISTGAPGEFASDPYGVQNLLPFLILSKCEPDESWRKIFLYAYISGLNTYSLTWLNEDMVTPNKGLYGGHLVAFSTRTYPPRVATTAGGLRNLLSFYFGNPPSSRHGLFPGVTSDPKEVRPVIFLPGNHTLAAATYSIDVKNLPSPDGLIGKVDAGIMNRMKILKSDFPENLHSVQTDSAIHFKMGRMHTNNCFWAYYFNQSYGLYSARTPYGEHAFLPGQTRAPGVMWTGSPGEDSNCFIAMPNVPVWMLSRTNDLLVHPYNQQWFQYGPTMLLVCDTNYKSQSRDPKYRTNYHYIFGGFPNAGTLEKGEVPRITIDKTYATKPDQDGKYRVFYNIKKHDPLAQVSVKNNRKSTVFIAVTSELPIEVGIMDPLRPANLGLAQDEVTYDNPNSFFIQLVKGNRNEKFTAVAIETAHPDDFPSFSESQKFLGFVASVRAKVSGSSRFSYDKPNNRLTYTDIRGVTLSKRFQTQMHEFNDKTETAPEWVKPPMGRGEAVRQKIYTDYGKWPLQEQVDYPYLVVP